MVESAESRQNESPGQERSWSSRGGCTEQVVQSLLDERRTKDEALRRLQARLTEVECERDAVRDRLATITNLRRYHLAERLAKVYSCVRQPRQGLPRVARKVGSLRANRWLVRVARRGYDGMPEVLRRPIRRAFRALKGRAGKPLPAPEPAPPPPPHLHTLPAPHFELRSAAPGRRVLVMIHQFFDQQGENMFFGGAERYLIELTRLVRDLGYEPEVYQSGTSDWVRTHDDVKVVGLDTGGDWTRINEVFHDRVEEGLLTIYLAFFLAAPRCHSRSIGISHGVFWDHMEKDAMRLARADGLPEILQAMENVSTVVSVDTSTTNWVRGTRHELAGKFLYIPNFVDTDVFHPSPAAEPTGRVVVLYPRRLCNYRGFWLAHAILPELMERFPNVDVRFVGKADRREEAAVGELLEKYPGRVAWYFLPPERMAEAYRGVDIAIIPTLHSEGTSLSCLEAQASGIPVIATHVGGLSDQILHDYNGLLIEPTAAHLREAIVRLVTDEDLRRRLGQRASAVAQTFGLDRWRRQWTEVLRAYCGTPAPRVDAPTGRAGSVSPPSLPVDFRR